MLRWSAEIPINPSRNKELPQINIVRKTAALAILLLLSALLSSSTCAAATDGLDIVGETTIASTTRAVTGEATGKSVQAARIGKDFHIVMTGLPTDETVQIELGFAELEHASAGKREFNLYVNEKRALSGFDIIKEAGGPLKSVVKRFTITPTRGFLDFHFVGTTGNAAVNYIRVSADGLDRLVTPPVSIMPGGSPDDELAVPADQQANYDVETGTILVKDDLETWNSGVPLGGIGTGKFAILPNGQFANVTINNSWDLPVLRPQGTFLAIAAKARSGTGIAKIMQVNPSGTNEKAAINSHPGYKEVNFSGGFPFGTWEFIDKDMYVNATVEAWSPLVPGDIDQSSLPGAVVSITLENPKSYPVSVGVAFSWEDLNGRGGSLLPGDQHGFVGRSTHKDAATSTVTGFQISSDYNQPTRQNSFTGDYFVGTPIKGATITRKLNWNPRTGSIPWWKSFTRELRLDRIPATPAAITGDPKSGPTASTLCVSFNLAPKEVRRVPFIVSWYMPEIITLDSADGNPAREIPDYAKRFGSSAGVASYIADNRFDLRDATDEWYTMIERATIPQWLKDHTLNSLFPLKTNSILLEKQRFAMLEAPADMKGMIGPIDLKMASGDFLRTMYPDLERTELRLYARAQDESGRIPRYVGNMHGALSGFDPTLLGTDWIDPTACWILQVASYWRESGDDAFVEEIGPAIIKARDFLKQQLESGNIIGTSAFSSGNEYAGSHDMVMLNTIAALMATPDLLNEETSPAIDTLVQPHLSSLITAETTSTFAALLAAEYALQQAALPSLMSGEELETFLTKIHSGNFAISKPVPVMESGSQGDTGEFSYPAPLQTYVGALALASGLPEIGLEPYVRMFQLAYAAQKAPWKQALRYEIPTGARTNIRCHRSAMAAWSLWRGMSGIVHDVPNQRLILKPQTIGAPNAEMEIPVFTQAFWGWLKYHQEDSTGTLAITRVSPSFTSATIHSIATRMNADGTPANLVTFSEPFMLEEGAALQFEGWPARPGGTVTPQKPMLPEPVDQLTTESLMLEDSLTTETDESTSSREMLYGGEEVPLTEEEKKADEDVETTSSKATGEDVIPPSREE